ncbi:MAG: HD domain-containing protein [Spirochaetaceae bacterium]|nr:HD domain-containing protein [Spirochaetaceae bacterium]
MQLTKKVYIRTGLVYCALMFIMYLAISLVNLGIYKIYTGLSQNSKIVDYLFNSKAIAKIPMSVVRVFSLLQFVPLILIVLYIFLVNKDKMKVRFINYPISLSSLVLLIYAPSLLLLAANFVLQLKTMPLFEKGSYSVLFIYSFLQSIFFFSLFFFLLNSVHRKIVLPKYFPSGNINFEKGLFKVSVKFLFIIFYVSVLVLPVFLLIVTYFVSVDAETFHENTILHLLFCFFILFGLVMMRYFINYFSVPLEKLKEGTQEIAEGDYSQHVNVVSPDVFGELADSFNNMTDALELKTKKLITVQDSVVTGMATMVESRDNSTGGHIKRTSDGVRVFVNALKKSPEYSFLTDDFYSALIKAAPMHDLGKIAVLDVILRKAGKFTDEEYNIMKEHSAEGARIVENVLSEVDDDMFKKIAVNVAHYHHEKWDGTGYPEKIAGEAIPLEARIMALADVFDALVSKCCYKESFSFDQAFKIIEDSLGTHFDPKLGKVFLSCREELEKLYTDNAYSS